MREPYDYDAQIKRLTEYPELIKREWANGIGLFRFIGDDTECVRSGCLTLIRQSLTYVAVIKESRDVDLTNAIRSDQRIPVGPGSITIDSLPVFKEWQERVDALENA